MSRVNLSIGDTMYIGGYHTITDVYTTALLLTKPSSDEGMVSGPKHHYH